MVGLNLAGLLAPGLLVLALHLVSVALTKALRSYSPEPARGALRPSRPAGRADDVAHHDERTERSAEALAVLTGLLLGRVLGGLGVAGRRTAGARGR